MRISAPVRAAAQRLALPTLIFTAAMLTVLGKADVTVIARAREALGDAVAPVLELVAKPMASVTTIVADVENAVTVYQQNELLREDVARLQQWQEVARHLAAENASLRALDKLVPARAKSAIAARVIADSGGAYMRNVLIDAGSDDNVARGQAAMTGEGLIGRVAEVGAHTARVLLLTDLNSHIPVTIERTGERALLNGDNSDEPKLVFLAPKSDIRMGDRIVTSGSGGVFPPSLPVGVVAGIDHGVVRIEPYAALSRLVIVRIVDYGVAGVLPESAVPPRRESRRAHARAPQYLR